MLKLSTVILAAGASKRLGFNKLCVKINGEAVIHRTVRMFLEAGLNEIVVVTGFEKERIEGQLAGLPVKFVHNNRHQNGMSTSIHAAFQEIAASDLVLFHLGDKPLIEPEAIARVIGTLGHQARSLVVGAHNGIKGHPVGVDMRKHREAVRTVEGEGGLRGLIAEHSRDVHLVECGEGAVLDLDTEDDIISFTERGYIIEKG